MRKLRLLSLLFILMLTGCTLFILEEDTDAYRALSEQFFDYQTNDISDIKNFQAFINTVTLETSIASVKVEVTVYSGLGLLLETRYGSGVIFHVTQTEYHVMTDIKLTQKEATQFISIDIHDYLGNIYTGTLKYQDESLGLSGVRFTKGSATLKALSIAKQPTFEGEPIMLIGYQRKIINALTMGLLHSYLYNETEELIGFKTNIPSDDFGNGAVLIDMTHQMIGIQYLYSDGFLYAISYSQLQTFYETYKN
jgi:hypothetical protein